MCCVQQIVVLWHVIITLWILSFCDNLSIIIPYLPCLHYNLPTCTKSKYEYIDNVLHHVLVGTSWSMIHVVHVIDVMSKYELCPFFTHINKICLFNAKDLKASEITVIQSVWSCCKVKWHRTCFLCFHWNRKGQVLRKEKPTWTRFCHWLEAAFSWTL